MLHCPLWITTEALGLSPFSIYFDLSVPVFLFSQKEEYLDALNKQEIAEKEFKRAVSERDAMAADVNVAKGEAQKVEQLYKEQDELLGLLSSELIPNKLLHRQ